MWTSLASFVLVAYLPGALLFRVPVANRERRARLAIEERVFWGVILSVICSSALALAFAASDAYSFRRLLMADALIALVVSIVWRGRLRYAGTAPAPTWSALIPMALVAVGAWLYFPPAEYIIGGKDPGIYINEGIRIAQRGSLILRDEVIAVVPPATRDLFFPSHNNSTYYGLRFMGFFVLDPTAGTVVGQFPHLYPVWIAIGYGLDGLTGALRTTGVWALLGLVAVYLMGVRAFGRPAAAIGTALLAISLVEVWFARYPNSEIPMQALLFAGLLATTRVQADEDTFFAPVAGVLFGALLFLRVDAALAIVALGVSLIVGVLDRKPLLRFSLLIPLAVTVGVALWYLTQVMGPYLARPLIYLRNLQPQHLVLLGGGALALLGFVVLARRPRLADSLRRAIPLAAGIVVVGAAVYAYFVRAPGGRLAPHDAMAFRTFAWYLPPAALAAAVAGYVLAARRAFWTQTAFLMTVTVFSFFVFYKIQIVPDHFWMARRFVSVILPASMLLVAFVASVGVTAGAAAPFLARRARVTFTIRLAIASLFLALVAWTLARATSAIVTHVEYSGLIPRIEKLAARFGDDELIVVESRNSSDLHVIALPLAYIYARHVLVLNSPRPDKAAFRQFLDWARRRYRHVYFLGGGGTDLLSRSIDVTPVAGDRFQVPEYESLRNQYPRRVGQKEFDFGLYRFTDPAQSSDEMMLDLGTMDDLHVVRFHAKEQTAERVTFRWSRDVSYVVASGVRPEHRSIALRLNDGRRPPNIAPAVISVAFDGREIGTATVTDGFHEYTFVLPADLGAAAAAREDPALLKIAVNTWNPRRALGTPDDRDLGVMVDRIEMRR